MTTHPRSMRPTAALLSIALSLLTRSPLAQPQIAPAQPGQEIVVRGGCLSTGTSDTRVRNSGIVVANGKFVEVGANLAGRDLSGARVVDLDDNATILPGM